jgi:integrase
LKAAAKRAGLPSAVGLHTLRHSAASVMLSAGVPLKVVSDVFGHASVAITGDIYGHVSPEVSREALTRLSDALS